MKETLPEARHGTVDVSETVRGPDGEERIPLFGSALVKAIDEKGGGDVVSKLKKLNGKRRRSRSRSRSNEPPRKRRNYKDKPHNRSVNSFAIHRTDTDEILSDRHKIKNPSLVGSRLLQHTKPWESLTSNPTILEWVTGYKLRFRNKKPPLSEFKPNPWKGPDPGLREEIKSLKKKGALVPLQEGDRAFFSSIFTIPKSDGSRRLIINLRPLNRLLRKQHFKMDTVRSIAEVVRRGDYLTKLDLRDAYLHVPVHDEHQKYLAFNVGTEAYKFRTLPFGLNDAPRVFTKLMKVPLDHLRREGLRCVAYLDDLLIAASSEELARSWVLRTVCLLESLGFTINHEKSILQPVQKLEYLGLEVSSARFQLAIPETKTRDLSEFISRASRDNTLDISDLERFIGQVVYSSNAVPWLTLFIRQAQRELRKVIKIQGNRRGTINLSHRTRAEMVQMLAFLHDSAPLEMRTRNPDLILTSDASKAGWGAICGTQETGGRWTDAERRDHINVLELRAAFFAMKCFAATNRSSHILLEMDNTSAVAYVNRFGGTRSKSLSTLAMEMWVWARKRNLTIAATHRPGVMNERADFNSRNFNDNLEISLSDALARNLFAQFGEPLVDLFASRTNSKCPTFYSLRPDPLAFRTDAFRYDWSEHSTCYAFPPFNLIARVLSKIEQDRANVILVTPKWDGQRWWATAEKLAGSAPYNLPQVNPPLINGKGEPHPLSLKKGFRLVAWKISPPFGKERVYPERR